MSKCETNTVGKKNRKRNGKIGWIEQILSDFFFFFSTGD
jgi:hypothetical protein